MLCEIKLKGTQFSCISSLHKTKQVVGKIKRQKCSSGTNKGKGCSQKHNAENSVT